MVLASLIHPLFKFLLALLLLIVFFAMAFTNIGGGAIKSGGRIFGPSIVSLQTARHNAAVIMLHGLVSDSSE